MEAFWKLPQKDGDFYPNSETLLETDVATDEEKTAETEERV